MNRAESNTKGEQESSKQQLAESSISKNPRVYYVLLKFKIDYVAYEHVL